MTTGSEGAPGPGFQKRVWTAAGIVALIVLVLLLLKAVFNVLLLVMAGALLAVYFHGLKGLIHRKTKIPPKGSMAISITLTLLILGGFFWLAGDRIAREATQLGEELPAMVEDIRSRIAQNEFGKKVLDRVSAKDGQENLESVANTFFRSTFGVIGDFYVIIILGLFFTAAPGQYIKGMVDLIPKRSRADASALLQKIGMTLAKWLKGMVFAMVFVSLVTGLGLFFLDVPMALALALLAGLLNFIPNFGPLIAMVPAILIALVQGPMTAFLIFLLYMSVQIAESTFVTPQIQKKLIKIPPALIIIAQLIMGVFSGAMGLLMATPLMAVLIVIVKELHVKRQDERDL